ncbi:hypothetical protein L7F22_053394 [Adiantum nelumboides]|nr:hypothetical protein [Adiantum nelumboides]
MKSNKTEFHIAFFTSVDSGQRALKILKTLDSVTVEAIEINLILIDYDMLEITGYDLLKIVKGTSSLKEISMVNLSSENVPNQIKRCLAEGAEDFFFMPLQLADMKCFQGHVRSWLSNTSEMTEHYDMFKHINGRKNEEEEPATRQFSINHIQIFNIYFLILCHRYLVVCQLSVVIMSQLYGTLPHRSVVKPPNFCQFSSYFYCFS